MRRTFGAVCGLAAATMLAGCALETTAGSKPVQALAVEGMVHGGQQAIAGAHVFLFAANTTGYGNASVSLLKSVSGSTTLDNSGGPTNGYYYVTTGAGGSFSITGDYTCMPGTQVYVYALGGNPGLGSGVNAASGLLAALGVCPSTDNFVGAVPFIWVNEVSTIAAAYAFAGFATDATHVSSSGTALAQVGIANAFVNATNLASLSTGAALATTLAGNGVAPQKTIDTVADILAACVNSTGAVTGPTNASTCYTLFNNALAGTTVPSDTATAAINIAHNPGLNVAALYGLVGASPPFAPTLSKAPNDFTMVLQFTGAGLASAGDLAIDAAGDVWVSGGSAHSISKLASNGAVLSGATGFTGGGLSAPSAIAIDLAGSVWVTNSAPVSVTKLSSAGIAINPSGGFTGGGLTGPCAIALDAAGDAWVANCGNGVSEFLRTGRL